MYRSGLFDFRRSWWRWRRSRRRRYRRSRRSCNLRLGYRRFLFDFGFDLGFRFNFDARRFCLRRSGFWGRRRRFNFRHLDCDNIVVFGRGSPRALANIHTKFFTQPLGKTIFDRI